MKKGIATTNYKIVLEKGEAKKSIFEMSCEEIRQAGERIFRKVCIEAEKFGQTPAVSKSKKPGSQRVTKEPKGP